MSIKVITDGDIGKWVEYKSHNETLRGRIKSFNDKFIFVVFQCDGNWGSYQNYTGCACRFEDIDFLV